MRWILAIFGFIVVSQTVLAQDRSIDQLEIMYDQGYYKKVLRKSNKLLANPEFDYSGLPSYYKSLALFRLAEDDKWRKRHKSAIKDAVASYEEFAAHLLYGDYVHAHYYEIAGLKSYMDKLGQSLGDKGYSKDAEIVQKFSMDYLISIKAKPDKHEEFKDEGEVVSNNNELGYRAKIVEYAKTLVGIKYVWAGSDESGFDCSGFTSYVLKKYGLAIPRTASGQMEDSDKVKLGQANKADLVFFGSGEKITHVGMVVLNDKGGDLSMIHASTSKGVIVTNVTKSTYWQPKLKGAGSYLD